MMDLTDRHCRYFLRQISRHFLLYTEMIVAKALIHGDRARLLAYDPEEHPLCLQLGGSDPKELAAAARWGEEHGYDEINLNVGCPSDRVQAGEFGLCLMKKPALVAECVSEMKARVKVPVSVKTRIGYDQVDHYEALHDFVRQLIEAGVDQLSVHARKGWLQGLSPKENRTLPPLQYEVVYRLKRDFPFLPMAINGGIETLEAIHGHLEKVDAVMLGRAAYYNCYLLAEVDRLFYGATTPVPSREEILERIRPYVEAELQKGTPLTAMSRHFMGLYHGEPNAKQWRRRLIPPIDWASFWT